MSFFSLEKEASSFKSFTEWFKSGFKPVFLKNSSELDNSQDIFPDLDLHDQIRYLTSLTYNIDNNVCSAIISKNIVVLNELSINGKIPSNLNDKVLNLYLNLAECGLEHAFIWTNIIGSDISDAYKYAFHRALQISPLSIDVNSALKRYYPELNEALFELTRNEVQNLLNNLDSMAYTTLQESIGCSVSKETFLEYVRPIKYNNYPVLPTNPPKFINAASMWSWIGQYIDNSSSQHLRELYNHTDMLTAKVVYSVLYKPHFKELSDKGRVLELTESTTEATYLIEHDSKKQFAQQILSQLKQEAASHNEIFGRSARSASVYYRNAGDLKKCELALKLEPLDILSPTEQDRYLCLEMSEYTKLDFSTCATLKPMKYTTLKWPKRHQTLETDILLTLLVHRTISNFRAQHEIKTYDALKSAVALGHDESHYMVQIESKTCCDNGARRAHAPKPTNETYLN